MKGKFPNGLRDALTKADVTASELARRAQTSRQNIQRLADAARKLDKDWAALLAPHLPGITPEELVFGLTKGDRAEPKRVPLGEEFEPDPDVDGPRNMRGERGEYIPSSPGAIPEVDVRGGLGGPGAAVQAYTRDANGNIYAADAVIAEWSVPHDFLRHTLRANPKTTEVMEVVGTSMLGVINSGDKVFVDTAHRVPSPPAIYALHDGFGVIVKELEIIMNTDPVRVRIVSSNKDFPPEERTLEEIVILGRVCGKVTPL